MISVTNPEQSTLLHNAGENKPLDFFLPMYWLRESNDQQARLIVNGTPLSGVLGQCPQALPATFRRQAFELHELLHIVRVAAMKRFRRCVSVSIEENLGGYQCTLWGSFTEPDYHLERLYEHSSLTAFERAIDAVFAMWRYLWENVPEGVNDGDS